MNNEHMEINDILKKTYKQEVKESKIVDNSIEEAYAMIKSTKQKKKVRLSWISKVGIAVAAAFILTIFVGISNPALAANIPVIGKIFSMIEAKISYPGSYSENATSLQEEIPALDTTLDTKTVTEQNEKAYRVTDGKIEVSLSEVAYDSNSIYLSVQFKNADSFPKDVLLNDFWYVNVKADMTKTDGTIDEYSIASGFVIAERVDGEYVSEDTFVGVMKLEIPNIEAYTDCNFTLLEISQDLATGTLKEGTLGDSDETVTYLVNDKVIYEGEWRFDVPLNKDIITAAKTEYVVNETNDNGIGIEKVVNTNYEIYAVPIFPEGVNAADYIVTIWDADGKPLESHGNNTEMYSVYGRDISSITVYVLTWDDWVENKAENYAGQPEKALFQKTIEGNAFNP